MYILLACGCSQSSGTKQLCPGFKAAYIARYRGMDIKGRMVYSRQGNFNLSVSQPKTLEGLEADYKNGVLKLSRDSMSCTSDEAYLPGSSFPSIFRQVLKGIGDGRAVFEYEKGEEQTYSLEHENGKCTITAGTDGMIKSLSLDKPKLNISFSGVSAI
jgi:hypothetical protein